MADPFPPPTLFVLARHAVTPQTGTILYGRAPEHHLSEEGRAQAKQLAGRLASLPIAAVYAAPIERTLETARVVAEEIDVPLRELPGVLEAEYGSWTGRALEELRETDLWRDVRERPSTVRFPGGESISEMQARAVQALEDVRVRHPGEVILVVSHADVIKALVAHHLGLELDGFQRIVVGPASVTAIVIGQDGAALLRLNDRGTLEDLRPAVLEQDDPDA